MLIVAMIVLRPISDAGLWWHLAHGRETFAGTMFPSQQLLTLETNAESDWLGGVPFFCLEFCGASGVGFPAGRICFSVAADDAEILPCSAAIALVALCSAHDFCHTRRSSAIACVL